MGESALTGSDVITEAITGNRRIQAGMKMSNGSMNFDERRGEKIPLSQNAIDELDNRLTKSDGDRYNV